MNSKVSEYIVRQLAATGFAVIDHVVARQLTHDLLWASARDALADFTAGQRKIREFLGTLGTSIMEVKLESRENWLLVATRSTDCLAERINWVTGLVVEGLRPFVPPREIPDAAITAAKADQPPAHQCEARREWFASRGMPDPLLQKKPAEKRVHG
jgi:hypothetical protein